MNLKLLLNGEEWGEVSYDSVPSLQYVCAENNLEFNLIENTRTIEIWSCLKGKTVWLSITGSTQDVEINMKEQLESFLDPYGIKVSLVEQNTTFNEDDLYMEVSLSGSDGGKPSLYIGLNSRLSSTDFSKILYLYREYIDFKGYKLLSNSHNCAHLKCIVQFKKSEEQLNQLKFLLTNCVLKSFIKNRKTYVIDLNLINLLSVVKNRIPSGIKSAEIKNTAKKTEVISEDEYEQAKLRKRNKKNIPKDPKAEVYFDYNLIPNRKTEKYTLKADFIIKNTGTAVLHNPKICFRVNPPERIEIGGQILPPEMSEIFSVQGEMGAEGWKYSGKDWLEKAYSTGEYWIEPIQDMELHPGETTGIEGIQFTIDNLNEQESSTILGFVLFEDQELQLSSNNKIMITF